MLIAGQHTVELLYAGRFLAGVCSGAAFAAGTAQIKELSIAPYDPGAGEQAGARRAAIALSAGFGLGALVAGLVAQWAPDPLVVAYVPHLIVMAVAMALLLGAPETDHAPSADAGAAHDPAGAVGRARPLPPDCRAGRAVGVRCPVDLVRRAAGLGLRPDRLVRGRVRGADRRSDAGAGGLDPTARAAAGRGR